MAENGNQENSLTRKQTVFIACLLSHTTILEACAAAGIGERTGHRWLLDPTFQAELHKAEEQAVDEAARALTSAAAGAVAVLVELMGSNTALDGIRLRAADAVLTRLLQFRSLVSIEERLSRLEASQHGNN